MNTEMHLKRVLSDLQAKARNAQLKSDELRIQAAAFREAADVVEVELTRLPRVEANTPVCHAETQPQPKPRTP